MFGVSISNDLPLNNNKIWNFNLSITDQYSPGVPKLYLTHTYYDTSLHQYSNLIDVPLFMLKRYDILTSITDYNNGTGKFTLSLNNRVYYETTINIPDTLFNINVFSLNNNPSDTTFTSIDAFYQTNI